MSASHLIRTPSNYFDSLWLIEVRANRAKLCWVKYLSIQPRLAENDQLWGCITSFAFSSRLKTDTGKCKSRKAKIHVSSSSLVQRDRAVTPRTWKLHLLESFILSGTGWSLIIPSTVDSIMLNAFAVSAKFPVIE